MSSIVHSKITIIANAKIKMGKCGFKPFMFGLSLNRPLKVFIFWLKSALNVSKLNHIGTTLMF